MTLSHDEHCEYHDYRDHQHRCACAERALALAHSKYNGLARTMAEAIEENTRLTDALARVQDQVERLMEALHHLHDDVFDNIASPDVYHEHLLDARALLADSTKEQSG